MEETTKIDQVETTQPVEVQTDVAVTITDEIKELAREVAAKSAEEAARASKAFYLTPSDENRAKSVKADERQKTAKFLHAVWRGDDAEAKRLSASVDANGGYVVPEGFSTEILRGTEDFSEIISRARRVPMTSNIQRLNEVTSFVTVHKANENYPTVTASTPTYSEPVLTTEFYTGSAIVPEVLIEDTEASNLLADLQGQFSQALAQKWQEEMLNGSVAGALGLFTAGSTILTQSVSTVTSGYNGLIWNDLRAMQTALFKKDVRTTGVAGKVEAANGVFIMSMDAWNRLTTITASDGQYIGNMMVASPQGGLMPMAWGRPVIVVNEAPSPTTSGTAYVAYTDLSKHLFYGIRRDLRIKINTSGTAADGTELNTADAREFVLSARMAHVTALNSGIVILKS